MTYPKQIKDMVAKKMKYALNAIETISAGRSMIQKRIGLSILALLLSASSVFAQGTVMPVPRQTWLTNSGDPAAGYWVCVYSAGTDTLATTYTTSALNVANTNPLVLDSAGRGTVFLSPGRSYKFVLKSPTTPVNCTTGTTVWSVDNVSSVPAGNVTVDVDGTAGEDLSAGNVAYLSDGSGSKNAGQWYKADADFAYASTTPQIGITVSAISSGSTGSIRIQGRSTNQTGLTQGSTYYVSATAGALTSTAPTNARYVGQSDSATSLVTTPNPPPVYSSIDARIKTIVNGRLSLTTGVPVTTADVTAATTVYWVPYQGNEIALYSGSAWVTFAQAQLSIAVPATTSTMYDVFMDYNSGTPALSLTAWTNDTTRATALTTQDGVYVKTGAATSRYLGSFRTTAVSGQTEDSLTKRYLWNYYNRVPRALQRFETNSSWTYTTATVRQANGSTANQVDVVIGVAETTVDLSLTVTFQNSAANVLVSAGIGLDSTTTYAAGGFSASSVAGAGNQQFGTRYIGFPAVGRHYYSWNEWSTASGSTSWYGAIGGLGSSISAGLTGTVWG